MALKTLKVVKRPLAVVDIVEAADFIATRSGIDAADRFVAATQKTLELFARMPGLGTRWESHHAQLADLRLFLVTKFPNHLLFYRPLDDGIELIRVLHGARDVARLLELEEEEPDS
jgi:toxin ParE1/3/4